MKGGNLHKDHFTIFRIKRTSVNDTMMLNEDGCYRKWILSVALNQIYGMWMKYQIMWA